MNPPVERALDLATARTLRTLDAFPWTGRHEPVSWCEWDHPHEGSRPLAEIISGLEMDNWPRFIPPGSTCLDIGAHSGDTTIPLALFSFDKANDRRGCVLAVEPNPDVFPLLDINVAINPHLADFTILNAAVTEHDVDEIELADHSNANCNGGILMGGYSQHLDSILETSAQVRYRAKGVSLDSLLRHLNSEQLSRLSFIKTDCEGYDKNILRGAADYLRSKKPTLFVEWFAWFTPEDDADFFAVIEKIGYTPLNPRTLSPLDRGTERPFDVLCIAKT